MRVQVFLLQGLQGLAREAGTPGAGERGREERGGFTVPDTVPTLVPQDSVGCGGKLVGSGEGL